jgi:hypothetical protein
MGIALREVGRFRRLRIIVTMECPPMDQPENFVEPLRGVKAKDFVVDCWKGFVKDWDGMEKGTEETEMDLPFRLERHRAPGQRPAWWKQKNQLWA